MLGVNGMRFILSCDFKVFGSIDSKVMQISTVADMCSITYFMVPKKQRSKKDWWNTLLNSDIGWRGFVLPNLPDFVDSPYAFWSMDGG